MNKNDLVEALAPRLGGRAEAALAVESFVDVVLREVAAGGQVGITGFGTFERVERAPRTGRNPHTGDAVPIAAVSRPRFRPGSYFTAVVADPDQLPASGLAGARVGSPGPAGYDADTAERLAGTGSGAGGGGVPTSIRRSAPPSEEAHDEDPGPPRRARPRTSGTPASVRADRSEHGGQEREGTGHEPALGGRLMLGGEDITRSMIRAKKAELARAKDDLLADLPARGKKGGKKRKKGKKKGGGSAG
ncbi:HU family DNA-binding protein [Ornithinimicrobium avium]|uniref:HU family DNA-binding protein n=1 Tax=Ornithinimicrobium avium TaxID=2283195 RepID=UPI001D189774|nr:HU family DNA-binding protein [Ornithinimicrobium avium]